MRPLPASHNIVYRFVIKTLILTSPVRMSDQSSTLNRMDRIDLFRTFARVVECVSFTRAADTLGMPRSSVLAAVIELETRVGARLLHRTTRKVSPTQDGAAFYDRCLRLIADVEDTEGLFRQTSVGPTGKLRVDVPGRIGRLIIAPALPEFLDRYPQLDIELGVTDRTVNLVEESVDYVLRVGPLSGSGLIARKIGDLPLINVASPAYLAQHGTPGAHDAGSWPGDGQQRRSVHRLLPRRPRPHSDPGIRRACPPGGRRTHQGNARLSSRPHADDAALSAQAASRAPASDLCRLARSATQAATVGIGGCRKDRSMMTPFVRYQREIGGLNGSLK